MPKLRPLALTAAAAAAQGCPTRIIETRKTVPGLRVLDKWAVLIGGGTNHRIGLFDMVMIKNNHIAAAGGVEAAIRCCQACTPKLFLRAPSVLGTNWGKSCSHSQLAGAAVTRITTKAQWPPGQDRFTWPASGAQLPDRSDHFSSASPPCRSTQPRMGCACP